MNDLSILYSFRRCPYAMRARMAVWQSGIAVELREILLRDKPAEMLAASPKGTVPVLVLPDGKIIDESIDIIRWALTQNDPDNWLSGDEASLIAANDGPFKAALDRYKYPNRYGLDDGLVFREAAVELLMPLEALLNDAPFLTGPRLGLSDIATLPFVRQFAATDQSWFDNCELPNIRRWLDEFIASPMFEAVMVRHAPWRAGNAPVLFHQDELFSH
jgi:glutathione S-transferase